MNCWLGAGRLGNNVELKYTSAGQAYGRVLMAVDRYGKEGKKSTDWIRLVLWGKNAENAARFVAKGSPVAVMGRISSEFWEKETEGGKKAQLTTEVVVERIDFLGSPVSAHPTLTRPASQPPVEGRGGKVA